MIFLSTLFSQQVTPTPPPLSLECIWEGPPGRAGRRKKERQNTLAAPLRGTGFDNYWSKTLFFPLKKSILENCSNMFPIHDIFCN